MFLFAGLFAVMYLICVYDLSLCNTRGRCEIVQCNSQCLRCKWDHL